ncbi:MAG TPA: DHH family phosphoesterase, partial [Phycisphaerae bacterium]|nr:DHH family phosphoesterase [Phycisphaerae bacterium]
MNRSNTTINTNDFIRVANLVSSWRRPVLLTHTNPDGDALGCLLAMRSILRSLGAVPRPLLYESPPPRYAWALEQESIEVLTGPADAALAGADGVLVLDTCTHSQLEPVAECLKRTLLPKVALDHHVTRDLSVDDFLIDETASAACLIVAEWAEAAGWTLDDDARLAIYLGIATDTGWFRFANTDARTLAAAAELTREGLSPAALFEQLYQRETAARFRLLAEVLGTVELHHESRLAVMTVTRDMLTRTGADRRDTEDMINYPLQIGAVQVSVLLVE